MWQPEPVKTPQPRWYWIFPTSGTRGVAREGQYSAKFLTVDTTTYFPTLDQYQCNPAVSNPAGVLSDPVETRLRPEWSRFLRMKNWGITWLL